MLRGAIVIDKDRKRKTPESISSKTSHAETRTSKKLRYADPTSSLSRDNENANLVDGKGETKITRDSWMMGEFDSVLGQHETETRSTKIEEIYTRNRHNIPDQTGTQQNSYAKGESDSDGNGPLPLERRKLKNEDILVGDGGRSWKERAAKRRAEQQSKHPRNTEFEQREQSNRRPGMLQDQRSSKRASRKMEAGRDDDNMRMSDKKFNFNNYNRNPGHRNKSSETIPDNYTSINAKMHDDDDDDDDDLNVLTSKALKCLMEGDSIGYEKIEALKLEVTERQNRKLTELPEESSRREGRVQVLLDVDEHGRYTPLIESSRNHDTDNVSVSDLYRSTRLHGEPDHDKHFEEFVLRKGNKRSKYDDDDIDDNEYNSWEKKRRLKEAKGSRRHGRQQRIYDTTNCHKALNNCLFCADGPKFLSVRGRSVIAMSPRAYLCFQSFRQCAVQYHLFIAPVNHISNSVSLDEDVYQDIRNFQKALIRFFDERDLAAIFVECSARLVSVEKGLLGGGSHMTVDCFGVASERLNEIKGYFKTSLSQAGSDWSEHKKIITVPPERRHGVRGVVPKNFPFFHVDFNLGGGMAHIIENEDFPKSLGRDVIQGVMELERHETYYKTITDYESGVFQFKKEFAPYDWTAGMH